ncbi:hypothetical protein WG66_014153 [Moniliophthora roreri]|uniref:Oxidase ustYa n=1 Tax=Moniliophthora roreri TaxID=221103 RepID=A0A0W0FPA9_MONRR|nr:hypothetical protein WG66_014153 [Moniliophthora roreri]
MSPKVLLWSCILSSLCLTISLFRVIYLLPNPHAPLITTATLRSDPRDLAKYTFEGDDYPNFLPIDLPDPVLMSLEETVHYSPSDPLAAKEWVYNSPWGAGTYPTGPRNRLFYVAMFHQMHCLRMTSAGLAKVPDRGQWRHLHHCFDVLRQSALCQADMTLEIGDFAKRDFTMERTGKPNEKVCPDWEAIYDAVGSSWLRWRKFMKATSSRQ